MNILWVASEICQTDTFYKSGGQPGHLKAWQNKEINDDSKNFFMNTLDTLQKSWLRPRYDGYMYFQDKAGTIINNFLKDNLTLEQALDNLLKNLKGVLVSTTNKPLEGITVLEFSQFLSGPAAGLRLSDLGANVIKIERPGSGDLCRTLYLSDTDLGGDSTLFHAINRNKKSFAANLKIQMI